jgi:hypothetical protein
VRPGIWAGRQAHGLCSSQAEDEPLALSSPLGRCLPVLPSLKRKKLKLSLPLAGIVTVQEEVALPPVVVPEALQPRPVRQLTGLNHRFRAFGAGEGTCDAAGPLPSQASPPPSPRTCGARRRQCC